MKKDCGLVVAGRLTFSLRNRESSTEKKKRRGYGIAAGDMRNDDSRIGGATRLTVETRWIRRLCFCRRQQPTKTSQVCVPGRLQSQQASQGPTSARGDEGWVVGRRVETEGRRHHRRET